MSKNMFSLTLFCCLSISITYVGADELDTLLSGFDEEGSVKNIPADEDGELDGLLEGFSDESSILEDSREEDAPHLPAWLALTGSVSLQTTVNFAHNAPKSGEPDYRGLSAFRGHGELIGDVSFGDWKSRIGGTAFYDAAYELNGQEGLYTAEYLNEYVEEIELNEAYLQGPISEKVDLKFGRQIVVWGKSDNIRVTDILNPLDLRYPGMLDIRYLRLPVTMTKLDYFWSQWNISAMLIHEPRFNRYTVYNGEFYPGSQPPPPVEEPEWSWDNQQIAVSINGIFSGWDLSLYGASVFQENAHLEFSPNNMPYRTYDRVAMIGTAANIALGNWLIKGEGAFWEGLKYSNTSDEKSRFDILGGIEYAGFSDTTISFELANRHIFDFEPFLEGGSDNQKQDWMQYALRFVRDFNNDTIHLTILISSYAIFAADGGFERFQLEYDLTDDITLTGGVVFYETGDYPGFQDIGDNDRLLFEIEYRF